jgi:hypothetical protein
MVHKISARTTMTTKATGRQLQEIKTLIQVVTFIEYIFFPLDENPNQTHRKLIRIRKAFGYPITLSVN